MQSRRDQDVVWTNDTAFIISMFFKLLIFIMFIYPFAHYSLFVSDKNNTDESALLDGASRVTLDDINNNNTSNKSKGAVSKRVTVQPHCPISFLRTILKEILEELYVKKQTCTPEDVNNLEKHKIVRYPPRNNKTTKPRGTVVIYIAVALLVVSVGAAFLDVYKAKRQQNESKTKPPLTRKCSLADLTVERHNRKELLRKDSILEEPESQQLEQQGPPKPLGIQPLPLHRRCSFPVAPKRSIIDGRCGRSSFSYDSGAISSESKPESRRTSLDNDSSSSEQRHVRILRRH